MKDSLKAEPQEQTQCRANFRPDDRVLDYQLKLTARGYPCRPDLLPQSRLDDLGQAVLSSNIIFAGLPDGMWILLYSRIGPRQLFPEEVSNLDIPANALFLVVDCRNRAEVDDLYQYVREIKYGRRHSDA